MSERSKEVPELFGINREGASLRSASQQQEPKPARPESVRFSPMVLHFRGCPAAPSSKTTNAACNCDQKILAKPNPLLEEAIERGLSAAYETRAGGYMGGNFEGRVRAGIIAAIKHYTEGGR